LPTEPYVFAQWRARRIGIDYHVNVEGHFYSVPYRFARSEVEVRLTDRTMEIFVKGASGSPCKCDRAATAST
jgi:transposase